MEYAIDGQGKRISALVANKNEQYFCPICGQPVIPRQGDIKVWHFAHVSACSDSWHYEMTDWHRDWQNRFPEECREVVVEKDGIRHRADVLINGYVIEFQHSPMTYTEFMERNYFYTDAGYKVIWVFDEIDTYAMGRIRAISEEHYEWIYASKTFDMFCPQGDKQVAVIFQLTDYGCGEEDPPLLVRLEWTTVGCKSFYVDSDFCPDLFSETGLQKIMLDKRGRRDMFLKEHEPYKIKTYGGRYAKQPEALICEKTGWPHMGYCERCRCCLLKTCEKDFFAGQYVTTFYCKYPEEVRF